MYSKAKNDGYQAGFEEGLKFGLEEGTQRGQAEFEAAHRSEIQKFHFALESFVDRANTSIEDWYEKTELQLTTLAIEIAKRALCDHLELDRQSVLAITKEALQEVRHGSEVRVRVNPFDVGILESHKDEILSTMSNIRNLQFDADSRILGGCEIETDGGVVDARIMTFLSRLAQEAA